MWLSLNGRLCDSWNMKQGGSRWQGRDAAMMNEGEHDENKDWLKLSERAFEFWDNEEDAYYDDIEIGLVVT